MNGILNKCMEIRCAEEQLLNAYKDRKFGGTVHTCLGQEMCPSVLSDFVPEDTLVVSNHRGHGHYLAHTYDYKGLFCEFLGREGAPSNGIGGSQHLHSDNFISNGIQGCTAPFAVGVSIDRPVVYYLGDGTFGEGTLYEAFNMSQLVDGNILFVVEDNAISQSTPSKSVLAGTIEDKFRAFGIDCVHLNSAKPLELIEKIKTESRSWFCKKPKALIVKSYRLYSHSKGDDTRSQSKIDSLIDPIKVLCTQLNLNYENVYSDAKKNILKQWSHAENQKELSFVKSLTRIEECSTELQDLKCDKRLNEVINEALDSCLSAGGYFIGEDIKTKWSEQDIPYGGAFGVSMGLSEKHENVISTSISEAGLVGVASGIAYQKRKLVIAEIMFADFSSLIVDQLLNGVDKYLKMFGKKLSIPLVIRIPYGMGRGYGPTHSQSPFEIFSSLTESVTISYNPLISYKNILENVSKTGKPVLLFESKVSYGDRLRNWDLLIDDYNVKEIKGVISSSYLLNNSNSPKINIITHGSYTKNILEYIKEYHFDVNILIVSELYNENSYVKYLDPMLPMLIIEESNSNFGALKVSITDELLKIKYEGKVVCNSIVNNIPANQSWEKELMLNEDDIEKLFNEALK